MVKTKDRCPMISVLVPVFGVEQYIERCARSLMEQTLLDIEFIFVDDCSNDKSIEILRTVVSQYPQRKVLILQHESNLGLAAARKTAYLNAQGKYWICCDSDDWVEPTMYEKLLVEAESNNADIVCCGFVNENGRSETCTYDYSIETIDRILSPSYFGWIYGAIWNKLVRAELYKKYDIEPWCGINMWEDSCLTYRLRILSSKTIILPDCLYHYNTSNINSITANYNLDKVFQSVEAVKLLDSFFINNGLQEESKKLINYLKVQSKEVLLRFPSKKNISLFKSVFPEATSYFWHYSEWNLLLKIRAWLIVKLPLDLALIVLIIVRKW